MKDRLIFDTTDADTIADSDSVGAYLRSSDGTLITHTTVAGKEALDVRLAEGVNVEVDLSHLDDSVRLGDGTDFFTSTSENGDIALDVHISNTSIAVTATDLDIRDLDAATDSVAISDGTDTLAVNGDGSLNAVVTATDLDIRDLDAATDSVESHLHDGAGTALTSTLVGADQALDVNIVQSVGSDDALATTAIATAANTLAAASTAEDVVASPLADRKYLYIYNNDNRVMYIGASGVSAASGFPVSPGSTIELRAGDAIDIEWVSAKLNHEIRTLELS
jgi:hypothetical protein